MNFKILTIFLILVQIVNCKDSNETIRIRLSNARDRRMVNVFGRENSINFEKLDSKTVQTSISHKHTGFKLKNFLLENSIAFTEVRKRSSRSERMNSTNVYEKRHMEYKDILKMLIKWKNLKQKEYENKIEIYEIGRTLKNRPIIVAKITDQVNAHHNGTKRAIFIESGIHAREWGAVDTVLYIMNDLIFEPYYKDVLKKFVFYFLVVANPDGYIYSFTTNRGWRKNLNKNIGSCAGVDLNRNFDIAFGGVDSNYCTENYKGAKAFSEKESEAERDFIIELIEGGNKIDLFLAFHTYGQQITYPYGYSRKRIKNWRESNDLLRKVTKNIEFYNNAKYSFGQTYHVIYPASGGSDDWIMSRNYTRFTYVMELRDKGAFGFFIPEDKIEENALDGVIALNTILDYLSPGIVAINKPSSKLVR